MYVGEMISWAQKRQAAGWTTPQLLNVLNTVQNTLYKYECPQNLLIDTATGRPPLLTTTQNQFVYNGPANTWRVSNILLRWYRNSSYDYEYYDYGINDYGYYDAPPVNTTEPININGNFYLPFYFVNCRDATEGGLPSIRFSRSPGDTQTTYFIQAYEAPTQITSKNQQLTIPDSNGAHLKYVYPAFLAAIEGFNQGNMKEAMAYIETQICPNIWRVMRGGAQGKRNRVTNRPY